MIRNERQFSIVRSRAERLRSLVEELSAHVREAGSEAERAGHQLDLAATQGELASMEAELADYEELKRGKAPVGTAERVEDLPRLLIRARIAAGLTQAELAGRLGLKPQQVQRYEATDYESASLSRLVEVADVLQVTLSPPVQAAVDKSESDLLSELSQAGLPRDLLEHRFLPEPHLRGAAGVMGLVARISHVFGWEPEEVLRGQLATQQLAGAQAYKRRRDARTERTAPLAAYAGYLAQLLTRACRVPEFALKDAGAMHESARDETGRVTLESALEASWKAGVIVLPLDETGGFDGAYWRSGGKTVAALNSVRGYAARWLFDLAHELGHIHSDDPAASQAYVEDVIGPEDGDERERRANEYAADLIFGPGRVDGLFEKVQQKAQGRLSHMDRAVESIARTNNVDPDALAFTVAFRLGREGRDWWAAAVKMQSKRTDPWQTVRDALLAHLDWSALGPLDSDLLERALRRAERARKGA